MSNPFQKAKAVTLKEIVRLVAATMPSGIEDKKLRAALEINLGVGRGTINRYLETLQDASRIELNDAGNWVIVG